jgi:hypothetical protein
MVGQAGGPSRLAVTRLHRRVAGSCDGRSPAPSPAIRGVAGADQLSERVRKVPDLSGSRVRPVTSGMGRSQTKAETCGDQPFRCGCLGNDGGSRGNLVLPDGDGFRLDRAACAASARAMRWHLSSKWRCAADSRPGSLAVPTSPALSNRGCGRRPYRWPT